MNETQIELVSLTCTGVTHREPTDWLLTFSDGSILSLECPWRLLVDNQIVMSGEDHMQLFGRESPFDVETEARNILVNRSVSSATVAPDTSDLRIRFADSIQLDTFTNSSGYEAWNLNHPDGQVITAMGGGNLYTSDEQ